MPLHGLILDEEVVGTLRQVAFSTTVNLHTISPNKDPSREREIHGKQMNKQDQLWWGVTPQLHSVTQISNQIVPEWSWHAGTENSPFLKDVCFPSHSWEGELKDKMGKEGWVGRKGPGEGRQGGEASEWKTMHNGLGFILRRTKWLKLSTWECRNWPAWDTRGTSKRIVTSAAGGYRPRGQRKGK